jgi:hypothetical protein
MAYKGKSKSARNYAKNPASAAKKKAYDKKYHSTPERKAYRRELEKKRRAAKKRGADTSKTDYDHAVGKRVPKSTNRGRKEKSRTKGYNKKKK